MALILGDVRPQGRQFGDLAAVDFPPRLGQFDLLGQGLAAVAATGGQQGNNLIHAFQRFQGPMRSGMALLSARLALARGALWAGATVSIAARRLARRRKEVWRSWWNPSSGRRVGAPDP